LDATLDKQIGKVLATLVLKLGSLDSGWPINCYCSLFTTATVMALAKNSTVELSIF